MKETKYIFVTTGESFPYGNGIVSSSIARLLQMRGFNVNFVKCSPILNVDRGALNVGEYGECYITADGHEVDLDLGYFERITGIKTGRSNYVTIGQIYQNVINKELRGEYCGEVTLSSTHVVDEIKRHLMSNSVSAEQDFVVIEIGQSVSDIDVLPYIEAMRQMKSAVEHRCVNVNISSNVEEGGINIAIEDEVISLSEVQSIYELPLRLHEHGIDELLLCKTETISSQEINFEGEECFPREINEASYRLRIGIIGEYAENSEAYRSIKEALQCATMLQSCVLEVKQVASQLLTGGNVAEALECFDGLIIAQDKGLEGMEGAIVALKWCRENDVPTLGIGQGMNCMVIEFARNVLGVLDANSTEVEPRAVHNVVDLMAEQKSLFGGVMRIGTNQSRLREGSIMAKAYKTLNISERCYNKYELNNVYRDQLETAGMKSVALNLVTGLVDAVEVPSNRWFVGTQFHLEYGSTIFSPNPLLMDFVKAIKENNN